MKDIESLLQAKPSKIRDKFIKFLESLPEPEFTDHAINILKMRYFRENEYEDLFQSFSLFHSFV